MKFKNELEQRCFDIAVRVLGEGVTVEHNKKITIESAIFHEVASFKGPPAKEVDVLAAELLGNPRVVLLVSCKLLGRKAEPAHVQEWCAVVNTMNKYSGGTVYFGLVMSPSGFTSGCEAWATSHNVGLVPPLKGRSLAFNEATIFRMFERVLEALKARVALAIDDLVTPPSFFDLVYRLVADFEGHQEAAASGRYFLMPQGWLSSFSEMYAAVSGLAVEDIAVTDRGTAIKLSDGAVLRFAGDRVEVGQGPWPPPEPAVAAVCWKNLEFEPCSLKFVKSIAVGKKISSAGDFGSYLEFGLDQRLNLGLHRDGLHVFSTENPVDDHRL